MESLFVALNAVVPFLIYIAFGYLVRSTGLVTVDFLKKLNQMVFKAFFPVMMFWNLYSMDPNQTAKGSFEAVLVAMVLITAALAMLIVPRVVKENPRRGVIVQALYRSNTVLFMLPLTVSIYGEEYKPLVAVTIAFIIPIYNVLAVMVLEYYRGGKVKPLVLFKNVITNPMIAGALVGFIFFLFKVHLPSCVEKPMEEYSNLCTPLGMFILGGTLRFSRLRSDLKFVLGTLFAKMVVIPGVMLLAAVLLGYGKLERFMIFAVFATPIATASYPMAQNMGGDGDLAGELVAVSTAGSVVTLFVWIFVLRNLNLI